MAGNEAQLERALLALTHRWSRRLLAGGILSLKKGICVVVLHISRAQIKNSGTSPNRRGTSADVCPLGGDRPEKSNFLFALRLVLAILCPTSRILRPKVFMTGYQTPSADHRSFG